MKGEDGWVGSGELHVMGRQTYVLGIVELIRVKRGVSWMIDARVVCVYGM